MTVFQAAVLGVVQGLTEFLPISSKTHLVVVPALLGWPHPSLAFVVLLHLGTLAGIVAYFARTIVSLGLGVIRGDADQRRTAVLLVVASVPAGVLGVLFEETFERLLSRPQPAALALVATSVILVLSEWRAGALTSLPRPVRTAVDSRTAVGMGLAQALALLPGVSRSGSTIGAGIALGLSRESAARFSFLMALVAIAGANVLEAPAILDGGIGAAEAAGFACALVSGYAAIWWLLRYLQRHSVLPFAAYCAVAGIGAALALAR